MPKYILCFIAAFGFTQVDAIGIGFIQMQPTGEVFLHTSEAITDHSSIYIQIPNHQGRMVCCKKLNGSEFKVKDDSDVVTGDDVTVKRYVLNKGVLPITNSLNIGASIIGADHIKVQKNVIIARNRIEKVSIKSCYGIEGINLSSYKNNKIQQTLYYSLGYDIEPTCQMN